MVELKDEGPENPPEEPELPGWEEFLCALEYMSSCGSFDWAEETLLGIGEKVRERERVSEGQFSAVKNIAESLVRKRASREGWNRPGDIDEVLSVFD